MTEVPSVPLIPRETLFGNPERVSPRLSPDGGRLAFLAPKGGVLNVWVGPVGSPVGGDDFEAVTDDRKRGIRLFFWAEDGKHLVYLQDEGGDENWRIHAVDPATKEDRDLTPFESVQAQILEKSHHFPDTLLVALNQDNPELHDAYRLTLSTGDLDRLAKNPGNVVGWVADSNFEVRAAMAATPEGGFDLLLREGDDWRPSPYDARHCDLSMRDVSAQAGDGQSAHDEYRRGFVCHKCVPETLSYCQPLWTRAVRHRTGPAVAVGRVGRT